MKTERRHELQHNWLADRVESFAEDVKPYAKAIAGVILALIVLIGTYLYLNKRAEAEQAGAWEKTWHALYSRDQQDQQGELRSIATAAPHSPAGLWSQLFLADQELTAGVNALFTNRPNGNKSIQSALDGYLAVQSGATDPFLQQRALYGIGRAQEALDHLKEARQAYEQIVKNYPDSPYAPRAKRAIDVLGRDHAKTFYDWFAHAEPPAHSTGGSSAGPIDKNIFDTNPLQLPGGLQLPNSNSAKTPPPDPTPDEGPALTPKGTTPATKSPDAKAPDTKSPDAKTPDTKSPATKSTDAKPADTKAPETKAPDAKTPDAKSPDATKAK